MHTFLHTAVARAARKPGRERGEMGNNSIIDSVTDYTEHKTASGLLLLSAGKKSSAPVGLRVQAKRILPEQF